MFSFLFGKKKNQLAGAVPAENTLAQLAARESELEKKSTQLERVCAHYHESALQSKKAGNTSTALQFMKREKLTAEHLSSVQAMTLQLAQQRATLEQTIIQSETLRTMKHAVAAQTAMQWTPESVSDLMDELHDVTATNKEIQDIIRTAAPTVGSSDEELLAELNAEISMTSVPVLSLPRAPTTAIETSSQPIVTSEIDEDMRILSTS